ncbi:MAG: hypothetical protein Q7R40_07450 [Phaeospirillum sp.]|nr:hypothetical protein [Phaeospirillum sp.]
MDQYKGVHNVACLLVINPAPPVAKLLSAFTGLGLSEIYFATKFSHTYQTIGRCSLRDRHSEEPIKLVVLSKAEADKLAELFEGAEVVGQLGILPQLSTLTRGVKAGSGEKVDWSLHRKAYFKYRGRMKGQGIEPLSKEGWFSNVRLPNLGAAPCTLSVLDGRQAGPRETFSYKSL